MLPGQTGGAATPRATPAPRGRLPPLKPAAGGGSAKALTATQRANQEELRKKKLSELCKLARAKDVDQYDIDEAVEAANPQQAMLDLLSGNNSPPAGKAGGAAAAGGGYGVGDECVGPVPGTQKELQVLCVTWNLKGMLPEGSLMPLLPTGYDVYAVATQESCASIQKSMVWSSKKAWEDLVAAHLNKGYEMVKCETLGATHLMILVRKSLVKGVTCVRSATCPTGIGNMMANKGGVGICMRIHGTSMLFMSSHFAAGQSKVKDRNSDFHRINDELPLHCDVPPTHPPGTCT